MRCCDHVLFMKGARVVKIVRTPTLGATLATREALKADKDLSAVEFHHDHYGPSYCHVRFIGKPGQKDNLGWETFVDEDGKEDLRYIYLTDVFSISGRHVSRFDYWPTFIELLALLRPSSGSGGVVTRYIEDKRAKYNALIADMPCEPHLEVDLLPDERAEEEQVEGERIYKLFCEWWADEKPTWTSDKYKRWKEASDLRQQLAYLDSIELVNLNWDESNTWDAPVYGTDQAYQDHKAEMKARGPGPV